MAEIINSNRPAVEPKINIHYPVWKVVILGAVLGILFWIVTNSLDKLFFDSIQVAGNVSMVVVSTIGVILLLRLDMAQPLLVAIASAASLWGMARWVGGLSWSQAILGDIALFAFAYVLFSWIARVNKIIAAMLLMLLAIVIIRIVVLM